MNVQKIIRHALNSEGRDPRSLRQFAALLYCKTVQINVKDFHGSHKFFNHILDAHILACLMNEIKTKILAELYQCLRQNN